MATEYTASEQPTNAGRMKWRADWFPSGSSRSGVIANRSAPRAAETLQVPQIHTSVATTGPVLVVDGATTTATLSAFVKMLLTAPHRAIADVAMIPKPVQITSNTSVLFICDVCTDKTRNHFAPLGLHGYSFAKSAKSGSIQG